MSVLIHIQWSLSNRSCTSDLATVLRNNGFTIDDVISTARVPIGSLELTNLYERAKHHIFLPSVKLRDPVTKIKCDININARLGRINTELLLKYCQLNFFFQPVLWSVKQWAARNGLVGSSNGKFNNYTLALMTIAFFQVRASPLVIFADIDMQCSTRHADICQTCKRACRVRLHKRRALFSG